MEAYRRLAAVTMPADVDDVRSEWDDRYGPPPPPAEALLGAARLRAECVRIGVRSVTVSGGAARCRGLVLPKSKTVRLERLAPGAKVSSEEVLVPLRSRRPRPPRRSWRSCGTSAAPARSTEPDARPTREDAGGAGARARSRRESRLAAP